MDLLTNYQQFFEWLNTDLGRSVLLHEKQELYKILNSSVFKNILFIGNAEFYLNLNQYNLVDQFIFIPYLKSKNLSDLSKEFIVTVCDDCLPIRSDTIDIIFLPHILEIVSNPKLILSEAYRVLRPEGKIIITGFNLFSIWGMYKSINRRINFIPGIKNFYYVSQIFNWLELLGFSDFNINSYFHSLPINNRKILLWLNNLEKVFNFLPLMPGNVYTISALKKVIKLTAVFDDKLDPILTNGDLVKNSLKN